MNDRTSESPPVCEGYIVSLSATGGRLRPFRRRNDLLFERDQSPDFGQLQRHSSATYRIGPASPLTGRRRAIDVRLVTVHLPPSVLTDPGLFGPAEHAEQVYTMRRAGIDASWRAGDLTAQQRAALCIDAEFDRAHRLSRLEPRAAQPYVPYDGDLADAPMTDQQEDDMTGRQTGTVDRLTNKGYGFLRRPHTHGAVFFHARSVAVDGGQRFDDLALGQEVTFLVEQDGNGRPYATDVRPLASARLPAWPATPGAVMDADDDSTTYDWEEGA